MDQTLPTALPYTITTEQPHSFAPVGEYESLTEALDGAWSLSRTLEVPVVVIDNDPAGDRTHEPTRVYRVAADYIGEE